MAVVSYDPQRTGVVIIDPVNDFLSEGGLWRTYSRKSARSATWRV